MKKEQLAGYLLEEVLGYLLESSGYRLVSEADDPASLVSRSNGLCVRGRGAEHQAEALGDLDIAVPFSLPIRLFVEAKCVARPTPIGVVRNAHGVVHDVNEFTHSSIATSRTLRQVQYRYSVFSTGGFTKDAQSFAVAHQISLIDLSSSVWSGLAKSLLDAASAALRLNLGEEGNVATVRRALRESLRSTDSVEYEDDQDLAPGAEAMQSISRYSVGRWARDCAENVLRGKTGKNDLLLGFVDAPFVLALKPEDIDRFDEHAKLFGDDFAVSIRFGRRSPTGGDWVIRPIDDPDAFALSFPIPEAIEQIVLAEDPERQRRAAQRAKRSLLSTITVYRNGRAVRLRYDRTPAEPSPVGDSMLREHLEGRPLDDFAAAGHPLMPHVWPREAIDSLLDRLHRDHHVLERVIRRAAELGGTVSRDDVYSIAEFSPDRTLRGFTRPTDRIRDEMVGEFSLPATALYPLDVHYRNGSRVLSYRVPPEFVERLHGRGADTA
ncbi:hypothetical protein GCM10027515_28660 [Schumannella luteola]|uniref:Restriction endonuclease n=1 Tax=Schumannella luteola TaxID=472059 RepID=A0A852YQ47_9MICO|nr:hypothetical protein [Schumannella luteola]NYG99335.1 hypothetical protein [Schumannella luteola]TPX06065.1 restriction endonuclease [Schumannella luteola]